MGAKQSKSRSSKKQNTNRPEVFPESPRSNNIRVEDAAASSSAAQNHADPIGKREIIEDEASGSDVSSVSKKQSKNRREVLPDSPESNIRVEDAAASSSAAQNPADPIGKRKIIEEEASDSDVSSGSSRHAPENYTSNNNSVQNSQPPTSPAPPQNINYPGPGMYYDHNYYPQSGNNYPCNYHDPNPAQYHQPNYPSYSLEQHNYPNYTYSQYSQEPQQPPQSFEDKLGAYFFGRYP